MNTCWKLLTGPRTVLILNDVRFDESCTEWKYVNNAGTFRMNIELPGLKSKYFRDAAVKSVQNATSEGPDIPAPDPVLRVNNSDIEENCTLEMFSKTPYLSGSARRNVIVPPEHFTNDTEPVSSVLIYTVVLFQHLPRTRR